MTTELLFVYGTLRRGWPLSRRYLSYGARVRPFSIPGTLYHLPMGFPIAMLDEPENRIFGDLFSVSDTDLVVIDEYEGLFEETQLYARFMMRERDHRFWVYGGIREEFDAGMRHTAVKIPHGDWTAWMQDAGMGPDPE